jgi:hypothetical protein
MDIIMLCFHLKKRELVFFMKYFICSLHQKHVSNSTAYKHKLRVFKNRVTMNIFKLKSDES